MQQFGLVLQRHFRALVRNPASLGMRVAQTLTMSIFFTADTHFGHANVIRFCNRPFSSVAEMDEALIRNWNEIVRPKDVVYHLGDFAWNPKDARRIFDRLNGRKHAIFGNHDHKETRKLPWVSASYADRIKIDGHSIFLCHYPALGVREDAMLHGHEHGSGRDQKRPRMWDMGVDCWSMKPVPWEDIRDLIPAAF